MTVGITMFLILGDEEYVAVEVGKSGIETVWCMVLENDDRCANARELIIKRRAERDASGGHGHCADILSAAMNLMP